MSSESVAVLRSLPSLSVVSSGTARPPTPIPQDLAVDGIDECLSLLPQRFNTPPITGAGETVHLHCTDGAGEWLVRLTADGLEVEWSGFQRGVAT